MLWLDNSKATVPSPRLYDVVFTNGVEDWHIWRKNIKGVRDWMNSFVAVGGIVFDPFTGGATIPAAAKTLSIDYIAFEIDPDTAANARERVRLTQPPLPLVMPEQLELI
jgi:hypothetical protein